MISSGSLALSALTTADAWALNPDVIIATQCMYSLLGTLALVISRYSVIFPANSTSWRVMSRAKVSLRTFFSLRAFSLSEVHLISPSAVSLLY